MTSFKSTCGTIEGVHGKRPLKTSDRVQDSPSKLLFTCREKENLTLDQESLKAFFHTPLQFNAVNAGPVVPAQYNLTLHSVVGLQSIILLKISATILITCVLKILLCNISSEVL